MPMSAQPHISAIFVASGTRLPHVVRLIDSLRRYPPEFMEIIAVDNASQPSVSDWLGQNFSQARVVRNPDNVGTSRAYNAGLLLARSKYLLVLNDDCCLQGLNLERAVAFLEAHESYGGLGLSLLNPDGSRQFTKLHLWSLRRVNLERPQHITFIGTNNLLCRRDIFDLVGSFDENLFFYNEDLEWSWRAHKKGVLFYYRPDFAIVHGYGFADKPVVSVERQLARDIANTYVYKKHLPIIFPFVKGLAKRSLRRGLRRTGRTELYSRLQRLLDLERSDVVSGTYKAQKLLLTSGNLECLL